MFMTPAGSAGYDIGKSLRLRSAAGASLTRTPAAAGSLTTWTMSMWVKRGLTTGYKSLFGAAAGAGATTEVDFVNDGLTFYWNSYYTVSPAMRFRDPSAWYHIVFVWDTTNAIQADRIRIYVNGVRQTLTGTFPGASQVSYFNSNTVVNYLGTYGAQYFDGYLAEVNFVDGQALAASSFGEFSSTSGQWAPKAYAGTYGQNGFYLPFSDATSTATLCADKSGRGNNWTATNVSLAAGATYDSMQDSPSNNYCTLNPLTPVNGSGQVYVCLNCNLGMSASGAPYNAVAASTMSAASGKWYAEVTVTSATGVTAYNGAPYGGIIGLANETTVFANYGLGTATTAWIIQSSGYKNESGTATAWGTAGWNIGDVFGLAVDMDAKTLTVYKNGALLGTPFTTLTGSVSIIVGGYGANYTVNFGQQAFAYSAPSGFKTLCAKNLPEPTIPRPEKYFDVKTYIGNGGGLQVGEIQKAIDLVSIEQSLRFNSVDTAYLSRTPAAVGDRRKFTWSGWIKHSAPGAVGSCMFNAIGSVGSDYSGIGIYSDALRVFESGGTEGSLSTVMKLLDSTKWYHCIYVFDSANATAAERQKLWVDGVRQPLSGTPVTQNFDSCFNRALQHMVGTQGMAGTNVNYFNGYMADIHFVDGQALQATDFGQWDANGYWVPKTYTGTYGTNGFKLTFADSSGTTATTLGKDYSGNGNNWTPSGFSVTAGITMDVLADSPTNSYATLNPLDATAHTISDGGLRYTLNSATNPRPVRATLGAIAGKYYYEITPTAGNASVSSLGVGGRSASTDSGGYPTSNGVVYFGDGTIAISGSPAVASGVTYTAGDVAGVAFDAGTGYVAFYKNGTLVWSGSALAPNEPLYPLVYANNTGNSATANFGQRPFTYTPPSGFVALCENNIAEYTYDIEKPDLVWIKSRSAATNHMLFDTARGNVQPDPVGGSLSNVITVNVAASTQNFNLLTAAVAAGYDGVSLCTVNCTVKAGVVIGSASTSAYAFDTDLFPNGCVLNLVVEATAYIAGCGGKGGNGSTAGGNGGPALLVRSKLNVTNNGTIGGGGGGGGGGSYTYGSDGAYHGGEGGGGGAGNIVGAGGAGSAYNGSSGTLTAGGAGSPSYHWPNYNGRDGGTTGGGGTGGALGSAGASGGAGWMGDQGGGGYAINGQGSGGAAGAALLALAEVTWLTFGSVLGSNSFSKGYPYLSSNLTAAQTLDTTALTAVNKNGFSVGSNAAVNTPGASYAAWTWKGGPAVLNQAGSLSANVRTNPTSGFSVVAFNAGLTAGNKTVGHGLGRVPGMIITKSWSNGSNNWSVWHSAFTNRQTAFLNLNGAAYYGNDSRLWANTAPTASVFSFEVGYTFNQNDGCIAYCFAEIAGFSKFSYYTGNGAADGPFVNLGFRPAFVMVKRADGGYTPSAGNTGDWYIVDSARDSVNDGGSLKLYPDFAGAENGATGETAASNLIDFTSNGFKIRSASTNTNAAGGVYVYAAFAAIPFKYANAF